MHHLGHIIQSRKGNWTNSDLWLTFRFPLCFCFKNWHFNPWAAQGPILCAEDHRTVLSLCIFSSQLSYIEDLFNPTLGYENKPLECFPSQWLLQFTLTACQQKRHYSGELVLWSLVHGSNPLHTSLVTFLSYFPTLCSYLMPISAVCIANGNIILMQFQKNLQNLFVFMRSTCFQVNVQMFEVWLLG